MKPESEIINLNNLRIAVSDTLFHNCWVSCPTCQPTIWWIFVEVGYILCTVENNLTERNIAHVFPFLYVK